MESQKLLKREDVPVENTWRLEDIFESDDAWKAALEELKTYPEKIAAFEGHLGDNAETLLRFFELEDEISVKIEMVYGYASMKGDQDTANSTYQNYRGMATGMYVQIGAALSFAEPELMTIPEETLASFYETEPKLLPYKRGIDKILKEKEHILSPKEEQLLSAAAEMANSPENINSLLHNADMKWPDVTDPEGNVYPLSNGSFVPMLESASQ